MAEQQFLKCMVNKKYPVFVLMNNMLTHYRDAHLEPLATQKSFVGVIVIIPTFPECAWVYLRQMSK